MGIIKMINLLILILVLCLSSCNNSAPELSEDLITELKGKPIQSISFVNDFYEFKYDNKFNTLEVAKYLQNQLTENADNLKKQNHLVTVGFKITKYREYLLLVAEISSRKEFSENAPMLFNFAVKESDENLLFYYLIRSVHEILKIDYLHNNWKFDRENSIKSLKAKIAK